MNKYQLELYTLVVEAHRISTAARLMHLTQPAVSNQIKHLERFYGAELLRRSKDGVQPTAAGEVLYNYAKEILRQFDLLDREMDNVIGANDQEVVIGATYSVGNYALPCLVWTFKDRYPQSNLRLEIAPVPELARRLLERSITLAVTEGPAPGLELNPSLQSRCLYADELILVAGAGSPWADQRLTPDSLQSVPLLLPAEGWGIREELLSALAARGIEASRLQVKVQMAGMEGIKAAVEARVGVGVTTRMGVRKELRRRTLRDVTPTGWTFPIGFRVFFMQHFVPSVAMRFVRYISQPEEIGPC